MKKTVSIPVPPELKDKVTAVELKMKTHDDRVRHLISGINTAKTALVVNNNLGEFNAHINGVLEDIKQCWPDTGEREPYYAQDRWERTSWLLNDLCSAIVCLATEDVDGFLMYIESADYYLNIWNSTDRERRLAGQGHAAPSMGTQPLPLIAEMTGNE